MIKDIIEVVLEILAKSQYRYQSRLWAYVLAPLIVAGVTVSRVPESTFLSGVRTPLSLAELRTDISAGGMVSPRHGVAMIVEPGRGEYRVEMDSSPGHVWTSLDDSAALANRERLRLDGNGVTASSPFVGVTSPVAIVVDGKVGNEVEGLGSVEGIEKFFLKPRAASSFVAYVLLACAFSFGVSLATGYSSINDNENACG